MQTEELRLDGNAAGGVLRELFAQDMTAALGTCAGCGTTGADRHAPRVRPWHGHHPAVSDNATRPCCASCARPVSCASTSRASCSSRYRTAARSPDGRSGRQHLRSRSSRRLSRLGALDDGARRHSLLAWRHRSRRSIPARLILLGGEVDFRDVWPEEERDRPVEHDAEPALPTRHLEQVVRSPQPPREDSREHRRS